MKRFFIIIVLILPAFIVNCQRQETTEDIASQIEDSITIRYLKGSNIFEGDILTVSIENESQYCLEFPLGFDLQVFLDNKGNWIEVPELGKYVAGETDIVMLYPKNDFRNSKLIAVSPDLSNIDLPADFYATIQGTVCDNKEIIINKNIPFRVLQMP